MMITPSTDLAGAVKALLANFAQDASADPLMTIAGATEDNVKVTGESIDTEGFRSALFVLTGQAILTEDKLCNIAVEYQTSANNSDWATAVALQASTLAATGGGGGSTEDLLVKLGQNVATLPQYIRFNVQLDLTHTSVDTAEWSATCILGGAEELPVT